MLSAYLIIFNKIFQGAKMEASETEQKQQTVFRVCKNRENPYFNLNRTSLRDERLSFKAKGIHAAMLSYDDRYEFRRDELIKIAADGVDSLKAGLKELKELGYITITPEKTNGVVVRWMTRIYETPDLARIETEKATSGFSPSGSSEATAGSRSGFPTSGKSDPTETNHHPYTNSISHKSSSSELVPSYSAHAPALICNPVDDDDLDKLITELADFSLNLSDIQNFRKLHADDKILATAYRVRAMGSSISNPGAYLATILRKPILDIPVANKIAPRENLTGLPRSESAPDFKDFWASLKEDDRVKIIESTKQKFKTGWLVLQNHLASNGFQENEMTSSQFIHHENFRWFCDLAFPGTA
jgi:hypothetical protein